MGGGEREKEEGEGKGRRRRAAREKSDREHQVSSGVLLSSSIHFLQTETLKPKLCRGVTVEI